MATYLEIRNLMNDGPLQNRVDVAVVIAAHDLLGGTPTSDEQKWAAAVFDMPRSEGRKAYMAVLAANESATVPAIQNATDASIQTNVDAVVPGLIVAFNAV